MKIPANLKKEIRPFVMLFSMILIWFAFNHVADGAFLQARNLSNLMRQMAITGILASGMVLVIVAAQIDLSIGSLTAVLGGIIAVMDQKLPAHPTQVILVALAAGVILGSIQGALTSYMRIPAFIVTLGGMMSLRGATMWLTQNSTIPLSTESLLIWGNGNLDPAKSRVLIVLTLLGFLVFSAVSWYKKYRQHPALYSPASFAIKTFMVLAVGVFCERVFTSYEGIPYPVLILAFVAVIVQLLATKSVWGRQIYALGGNAEAAYLSGVPVRFRTFSVFVLTGVLSAISGLVLTARVGSASPDSGQLLELDAIASCVIGGTSLMGGRGTIFGALLGALVIESLNNGMSLANMEPYWQYLIKGLVLVIAVGIDMASREKKGVI